MAHSSVALLLLYVYQLELTKPVSSCAALQPPPPELGYTITASDLDSEKKAALNRIKKVLEEIGEFRNFKLAFKNLYFSEEIRGVCVSSPSYSLC